MSNIASHQNHPKQAGLVTKILVRLGQVIMLIIVQAVILFLAAGTFGWVWAWIFLCIYLISISINSAFLFNSSPETIAERGQAPRSKDWDKIVAGMWSLVQFLLLPLSAGLDARFHWTQNYAFSWHLIGAFLFSLGLAIFGWALIINTYFSTVARIQKDRGQVVCSSGPYRFVRHPGYMGAILQSIGTALLLGSTWSLIPAAAAAMLMVIRTWLEDRMLKEELPGYMDYAKKVNCRLLPGVW